MDYKTINELGTKKHKIAVTITLDVYPRYNVKTNQNSLKVKNIVKAAKKELEASFTKRELEQVLENLDREVAGIQYTETKYGLVIFVSEETSKHVHLPFNVGNGVKIDDHFKTRNLLRALKHGESFLLLTLSQKEARLFEGYANQTIEEVRANGFPFTDNRFVETDTLKRSFASAGDKASQQFYRQAYNAVVETYKENALPLIVVSTEEAYANFNVVDANEILVVGHIRGNYDSPTNEELKTLAISANDILEGYQLYLQSHAVEVIQQAYHQGLACTDLFKIHEYAINGQVARLYIEENYFQAAVVNEEGLLVGESHQGQLVDDAVNLVIQEVLAHGGEVAFVDPFVIEESHQIAAVLRFK